MNLNFNNVQVLGISQEIENFDSDFNFSKIKSISVSGLFLDLQNTEGVKNITEASELFIKSTKTNRGTVLINGVNYGEGFVSTFSIQGEQIRTAEYSAEITVRESSSLSDIALSQNQGGYYNLSTNSSGITNEDLKFLTSFSESFNFSVNEQNTFSLSHDVECLFSYRKSLITNENSSWNGSTVGGKSVNLGNKGKGSIRISGGLEAHLSAGQLQSGVTYVLEFEYLGQYVNKNSWTDVSLYALTNVNNKNNNIAIKTVSSRGMHKLEFTPDTTGEVFLLLETLTNAASFDNVRLYKKNEMPLEKAKALSELLFDSSPYYAVLESNMQNQQDINAFDDFTIDQSFDQINLNFTASKRVEYAVVKSSGIKKYSAQVRTSKSFQENGVVSISESIEIRALKDKTESALREYINSEKSLARNRVEQSFSNYQYFIDYDCPTPTNTKTPVDFSGFSINPTVESENIDINSGTVSLSLVYSNDPTLEDTRYINSDSVTITSVEGNNFIQIAGSVTGIGNSSEQRFNNARAFQMSFSGQINKAKQNNSILGNFNLYSRSIQSSKKEGSIQYDFNFSDSESLEYSSENLIKSYDIEVSTSESGLLYNEFSLSCLNTAQVFRDLRTPEELKVKISIEGYLNSTAKSLYDEAKNILNIKGLLLGEDSKQSRESNWDNVEDFLRSENFSFSEESKTLTYSRASLNLKCPPTPTPGQDADFGGQVYTVITPSPVPTPTEDSYDYFIKGVDPTPISYGNPPPVITPYQIYAPTQVPFTPFSTINQVPTPTLTPGDPDPTPTPQQTPTLTLTPDETRLVRRLIPENWNKTIAELLPGQQVSYGVRCLDDNSQSLTMTMSYAENTLVRDCVRAGNQNHQSFSEIYFTVPIDYPEPAPLVVDDGCAFEYINLPSFWGTQYGGQEYNESLRNAWADLDSDTFEFTPNSNVELIGYELPGGQFSYVQSGDLDLPIILSSEYNNYHPNYLKQNSLIITGRLYYKNCNQSIYQPYYSITEVDVPKNHNNTIESLAPTSGFSTYFGVESCSLDLEHYISEDQNENLVEREDLSGNTLVDGCEADLSFLPQINKVFFQQLP